MGEGGLGLMAQVIKDDQDIEKKKKTEAYYLYMFIIFLRKIWPFRISCHRCLHQDGNSV